MNTMPKFLFTSLFLALFLLITAPSFSQTNGVIAGTVVNFPDFTGIPGANITIAQNNTTIARSKVASDGTYAISNLLPGTYSVAVAATNFKPLTATAIITANHITTLYNVLIPIPGIISGVVTNEQTGALVLGALVTIIQGGATLGVVTTGINGEFSLSNLHPGTYSVTITHTNFSPWRGNVTIATNQTTTLNSAITPLTGGVTGIVIDSYSSTAISGAVISIFSDGSAIASTTTNSDGTYAVANVNPGTYSITITDSNYSSTSANATVHSHQITSINIALDPVRPSGTIQGTIASAAAHIPLPNVKVEVLYHNICIANAITKENGCYCIGELNEQDYYLRVTADYCQTILLGVSVPPTQKTIVDFFLEMNPGTLCGLVVDAIKNTPLSGVAVEVFLNNGAIASTTTDEIGLYTIPNLSPNDYTVIASSTNYQTSTKQITILADQTTSTNISLQTIFGVVSGIVKDGSNHAAISGAHVSIFQDTLLNWSSITDLQGKYTIRGLPPGTYRVIVTAPHYQPAHPAKKIIVFPHQTTKAHFTLQQKETKLVGKIIDDTTHQPIEGARIEIFSKKQRISSTLSHAKGAYIIKDLSAGSYDIIIHANHYQEKQTIINILANQTNLATFSLAFTPSKPRELSGKIKRSASINLRGKYIHVIQWLPSHSREVVEYHVFEGTKRIAIIPTNAPLNYQKYTNHNRETLYSVSAVDAYGRESERVTIILNKKPGKR